MRFMYPNGKFQKLVKEGYLSKSVLSHFLLKFFLLIHSNPRFDIFLQPL